MITSLFVGDGDESYLEECLQKSFGVELTDEDVGRCRTMGDVEALVWRHAAEWGGAQDRCMTAMAFHELRRTLAEVGTTRKIRPSMAIAAFGLTPFQMQEGLRRAGLGIDFNYSRLGRIGFWTCLIGVAALLMSWHPSEPSPLMLAAAIMSITLGYLAVKNDPGDFRHIKTAGDAARQLADKNFAHFASRGARYSRDDILRILREVAAEDGRQDPDQIGHQTLLIHPRKKWFQIFGRS